MKVPDARLIAGDARAHILAASGIGFVWHLRVADQGAGHAADVGLTTGNDQLGFLRLIDAPGDEQRNRQAGLERPGLLGQVGRFDGHRRHDMHRTAQRCRRAGDDVHVIQLLLQ
ncbi:hypothetical protein D3C86_1494030 [compost metagenome]